MKKVKVLGWGKVTRHRETGDLGARVDVLAEHGNFPARYHVDSHGKNPAAVAKALDVVEKHHADWTARTTLAHTAQGQEFTVGMTLYRVVDFTVPVCQPDARCRVLVGVREVLESGELRKVEGFPMTFWYDTLSDVPANEAIIADVKAVLEERSGANAAHENFVGRVGRLLE